MSRNYSQQEVDDLIEKALNAGRRQCVGHDKPSPATLTMIEELQQANKEIRKKLEELPTMEKMELANRQLVEEVMERAETKFASKLTEKIVYGMVGVIVFAFLGALVTLIIR